MSYSSVFDSFLKHNPKSQPLSTPSSDHLLHGHLHCILYVPAGVCVDRATRCCVVPSFLHAQPQTGQDRTVRYRHFRGSLFCGVGNKSNVPGVYTRMGRFFTMSVTLISVIVMVVCYTLVAVKMLVKLSASRKKVGVLNTTRMTAPDTQRTNAIRVWRPDRITQPISASAKVAKTYKGVSLLLIITAVCVACWVPQLMSYVSMSIPSHVRGLSLVNSAANPLIYSIAGSMFRNDAKLFYRDA